MLWALVTLAIYLTPFFILGVIVRSLLRRNVVDLSDIHSQAGPNRGPRKVFLLGSWRTEK